MVHKQNAKIKVAHDAAAIQALEDDLAKVSQDLRDIRNGLAEKGLESVDLKAGTFKLYLSQMRQMVKVFRSEFERAVIQQQVQVTRESAAKRIADRAKKKQ